MDVMALDAGKRIEATVQKLRDTSRDNALVLRSTAAGSAASRTQAFLVNCVRTPLSGLTEEAILSYAATRAVFEAGFKLKLQSRTMAQSGSRPAKPRPLPNASYHQRTNFATMPHWQAINATGERVAEELVPTAAISKILQSIDPVIPSAKPGFGPYHSAKKRCLLLGAAAERMGLPSVPLVSLMDLQRHSYFADRCIFEDVDHDDEHENDGAGGAGQAGTNGVEDQSTTDDAQSSQQAMPAAAAQVERSATRLNSISVTSTSTRSTAALAAVEGTLKSTFAAQIASSQLSTPAIVAAASAMAKPSNAHKLHRIRAKAEREKRLAGADLSRADPGADIPGAAVFEWTRRHGHQAQAMLQQSPSATEEFWLCLKGIVFLADTRTIEDAGRRLYYDMVLIPLYTGRDVTSAFAKMSLDDRALSADDQVPPGAVDAAAEDDEMNWGINSDDEDDFGGPWAEVCRAEQELDFTPQVPCSLTAARLRNQYRHRESAFMTPAQRKHVDRVFEMIARDFPVIGVLDDASRELWL